MSARDDLAAWVAAHTTGAADVAGGSKLIAAYVAECVRADRAKQATRIPPHRRSPEFTAEQFAAEVARRLRL